MDVGLSCFKPPWVKDFVAYNPLGWGARKLRPTFFTPIPAEILLNHGGPSVYEAS
jgi:hypothetical protein